MHLTVNDSQFEIAAPGHERLITTLRDQLGLRGCKLVCGRGECGACTVLIDDAPAYACLTLTTACRGKEITTIEGVGTPAHLHPVQSAFIEHDAAQCGFCTPGQVLAAIALLSHQPTPSADDIVRGMSGNLCRCGTYPKIVRAVLSAATTLQDSARQGADAE